MNKNFYYAAMFAFAVIFIAMYWLHPMAADDFVYANALDLTSWNAFWTSFWDHCYEHITGWSARLPNLLGGLIALIPNWIGGIIFGGCAVWMFYLAAKIAGVWLRDIVAFGVVVFALCLAFPWFDYMFVRMFACGYVVGSCLMLAALLRILSEREYRVVPSLLLGFFIGWWHEAFAGTVFCCGAALLILFKRYRKPGNYALLGGIVLAILLLISAGGPASRLQSDNVYFWSTRKYAVCVIPYLTLYALAFLSKRLRKELLSPFFICTIVGTLASLAIFFKFGVGAGIRPLIPGIVLAVVGVARMVYILDWKRYKSMVIASVVCIAICVGEFVACIPWFNVFAKEVNFLRTKDTGNTTQFVPLMTVENTPLYILGKPKVNDVEFPNYVVPVEFKDFDVSAAKQIGEHMYLYKGYLIATQREEGDIRVCFDGVPLPEMDAIVEFEKDGQTYYWYEPKMNVYMRMTHKITKVQFEK